MSCALRAFSRSFSQNAATLSARMRAKYRRPLEPIPDCEELEKKRSRSTGSQPYERYQRLNDLVRYRHPKPEFEFFANEEKKPQAQFVDRSILRYVPLQISEEAVRHQMLLDRLK